MTLKEQLKYEGQKLLASAGCGVVAGLYLTGVAIGVNTLTYGVKATLEVIEHPQPQTHVARFETARNIRTPNLDGVIATFVLDNGQTVQVNDNAWVTQGKWLGNRTIPTLKEGTTYDIQTIGSWTGETLLSATPKK